MLLQWGRWLRNLPRRLQALEDSLSDEDGSDAHGQSAIRVPRLEFHRYYVFPGPLPGLSGPWKRHGRFLPVPFCCFCCGFRRHFSCRFRRRFVTGSGSGSNPGA
eukprot:5242879-Pyramimonas_sp.AAC.1